ncbi:hypothetical protein K8R47_02970 [archaeon]|nr:hypothetical protein [archaeon]
MKKNNLIVLIVIIMLIVSLLVYLSYSFFNVILYREYLIDLTVGSSLGFNVDNDAIHFGIIPKGGVGERYIYVDNFDMEKVKVKIKIYGDLKNWVYVSDNNFYLNKGKVGNVTIYAFVPEDAEYGDYGGKLRIILTRF